ncbi:hypothetical protein AWJ20_3006 [Sugiyamaella lignohabitans]|uniref:Uncharacterized protein n=1 Tax=Sugiyamaella lignohabitans TaxID=796027 RepID=A0A167FJH5_9ASCO|nr:uncharacterized protein AWJ20_3006 [Sugiyamaella lignohabitans]ANB15379.1 hypothetical protein AWJ20_3006 [Sugiyamaella lignohabitans]
MSTKPPGQTATSVDTGAPAETAGADITGSNSTISPQKTAEGIKGTPVPKLQVPIVEATRKPSSKKSSTANESDDRPRDLPVTLIAVTFKEAVLDSPTFRASMNHVNEQLDSLDRWIESFSKALNKLSQEMDGRLTHLDACSII